MTARIIEFFNNLLKMRKEQLFPKGTFLRNKVPIKPVLGLTGLGMLFMAVRPLLYGDDSEHQIESAISLNGKPEEPQVYTIQKTLYLMKEKEKILRKQEAALQQAS